MKAKVEVDPANGKFRIKMQTCDTVYSPWTAPNKLASLQYNKDVLLATMRTRSVYVDHHGVPDPDQLACQLIAGKVYRVAKLEELEPCN